MTLPLIIDFVVVAGALLTTLCWLPQMLRTVREKYTRALSLPATSAFTVGILLWLNLWDRDWRLAANRFQRCNARVDGADPGDEVAIRLISPSVT
jgi:hypothetical protein